MNVDNNKLKNDEVHTGQAQMDIAVIGMSGRFPGAKNITEYWKNLSGGVSSVSFFTEQQVDEAVESLDSLGSHFTSEQLEDPNYVKAGYVFDNIEDFDAGFFDYNPAEAKLIDPQQRIFLETAWETFEDAGYDPLSYKGVTGIFASTSMSRYFLNNVFSHRNIWYSERDLMALIGNEVDYLSNRVAYKLNLRGPAIAVQSACSSSLVAIHLACQSLKNGECDTALAGASVLMVPRNKGYMYREGGMLSRDGYCRVFDEKATGTVFANGGVGCVLLKPLIVAERDGDNIYAVIKGTGVANDGSDKSVMTAPNVEGQVSATRQALAVAGFDASSISYIEAHGTGTQVGDPTEVSSLTKAFKEYTNEKQFCAIGSVKTNIGHLDRAAGMAGIIKTVLALKHRQIPPHLHYETPNPKIDFGNSPFYVNTDLSAWETDRLPRRAGVNSFGVGGTNAHVVLEEAPVGASQAARRKANRRPWQLLTMSARSPEALDNSCRNLAEYFTQNPDVNIADATFTLQCGRHAFDYRRILVVSENEDTEQLAEKLRAQVPEGLFDGVVPKHQRGVVFMFSGQGAQYVNMGKELYQNEAVYREMVDTCAGILEAELSVDLRTILYPPAGAETAATEQLNQTSITQSALFVTEYALAQLLLSWGVQVRAMVGHSIGEYVAACLAGVFILEDALKLVALRGRLMQEMPAGTMLSVILPEQELLPMLSEGLSLAGVNSPSACVVSGPEALIESFEILLIAKDISVRRLHTSHAFHSSMMDPILPLFTEVVNGLELQKPQLQFMSNVSGTWITDSEATSADYWARHLRSTVRFAANVEALTQQASQVLVEVGPGNTLASLARQSLGRGSDSAAYSCMHHPNDPQPAHAYLLTSLGRLWGAGVEVDWNRFNQEQPCKRVSLPSYPFERQRYWIESNKENYKNISGGSSRPAGKEGWYSIPSWKRSLVPTSSTPQDNAADDSLWLIFHDSDGVGKGIEGSLRAENKNVINVHLGKQFAHNEDTYTLRPSEPEDFEHLLDALMVDGELPSCRVLFLWGLAEQKQFATLQTESFQDKALRKLEHGFYGLLNLTQAVGSLSILTPLEFLVISSNLHAITGAESLVAEQATVLGPCKVIPLEYPNIRCRNIDLDILFSEDGSVDNTIIAEVNSTTTDQIVAYRNSIRWVQTFEIITLPAVSEDTTIHKPGGVYFITGGMGGLGLKLAQYLASHASVKLALLGRSAMPDRAEWDEYLISHAHNDRVSSRIRKIRELEALGAEVLLLTADVTDQQQMSAAVGQVRNHFGVIDGVIHAAGVAGGGMIQLKTREMADKVILPKLLGTLVLDDLLKNEPLDFFVLCSSLFSVVGGVGQVDYCAANSFFDAFAQSRQQSNSTTRYLSINWDAWQEIGMAVDAVEKTKAGALGSSLGSAGILHPLLGHCIEQAENNTVYEVSLSVDELWILEEHKVLGNYMLPGTGYLQIVRAAATELIESYGIEIHEATFITPLEVLALQAKTVRINVERVDEEFFITITSQGHEGKDWIEHFTARFFPCMDQAKDQPQLQVLLKDCDQMELSLEGQSPLIIEKWNEKKNIEFGDRWRNIKQVNVGERQIITEIELTESFREDLETYTLHPALLDMATGVTLVSLFCSEYMDEDDLYLPWSYDCVRVLQPLPSHFYSHCQYRDENNDDKRELIFDICIFDQHGQVLVEIEGFTVRAVPENILQAQQQKAQQGAQLIENVSTSSPNVLGGAGIKPEDGVDAFARIMAYANVPQVVVSSINLEELMADIANISQSAVEDLSEDSLTETAHERPKLVTDYVAPRTELEKMLVSLWMAVLGIDKVGVHDNLFELGADSILTMQVVSRARKQGVVINANQIFKHETVAQLAKVIGDSQPQESSVNTFEALALSAMQRYCLEEDVFAEKGAGGNAYLFTLEPLKLEPQILEQAIIKVGERHQVLRTRFVKENGVWLQKQGEPLALIQINDVDPDLSDWKQQKVYSVVDKFYVEGVALCQFFLINTGSDQGWHFMLLTHELLLDAMSVNILLTDLQLAYQAIAQGAHVEFTPNMPSLLEWTDKLQEQANSKDLSTQISQWIPALAKTRALPRDNHGGAPSPAVHSIMLDAKRSASLQAEDTHVAFNTDINDVLLSALTQSICQWTEGTAIQIWLALDGRERAYGALDLTRTVGQFTFMSPAVLSLEQEEQILKSIKEQLWQLPAHGAGYSLMRYLNEDQSTVESLKSIASCHLSYAFVPAVDNVLFKKTASHLATYGLVGKAASIEIRAQFDSTKSKKNRLRVDWFYDANAFQKSTIEMLAENFVQVVSTLVDKCLSSNVGGFTASDFPEMDLSENELAALDTLMEED